MTEAYYLTEEDVELLKRFHEYEERTVERVIGGEPTKPPLTPEVYVAVPPCGLGIPARKGTTPGHIDCCIFRLKQLTKGAAYKLVAIKNPDGTNVRRTIYNVDENAWVGKMPPDEYYVVVEREKTGRWLVGPPPYTKSLTPGGLVGGSSTSSSSSSTTRSCASKLCKFVWSASSNHWSLFEDRCNPSTTSSSSTSSTTTDPSASTTTASGICICPVISSTSSSSTTSDGTTSSTSSSSTTTAGLCKCTYPTFCGTTDGECTFTHCTSGTVNVEVSCVPSTTSTSTTSSTSSSSSTTDPVCNGCSYDYVPGRDTTWRYLSGCCPGRQECVPTRAPGPGCDSLTVSCTPIIYPDPGSNPCRGKCYWVCDGTQWWWIGHGCFGGDYGCSCDWPGECGECGGRLDTPCYSPPPPGSTTTPDPHTSSTSSTSSSTPRCGVGCKYKYSVEYGVWLLQSSNCAPTCHCSYPGTIGLESCQVEMVPCVDGTSTSSSTTSTTSSTTSSTSSSSTTTWRCIKQDVDWAYFGVGVNYQYLCVGGDYIEIDVDTVVATYATEGLCAESCGVPRCGLGTGNNCTGICRMVTLDITIAPSPDTGLTLPNCCSVVPITVGPLTGYWTCSTVPTGCTEALAKAGGFVCTTTSTTTTTTTTTTTSTTTAPPTTTTSTTTAPPTTTSSSTSTSSTTTCTNTSCFLECNGTVWINGTYGGGGSAACLGACQCEVNMGGFAGMGDIRPGDPCPGWLIGQTTVLGVCKPPL